MLLCYMHRDGNEAKPELCIITDKPDQFSRPVSIASLCTTEAASIRLGPNEGINVWFEDDGGVVIEPVKPSRIFLTPNQPDLPGFQVARVKVVTTEQGYRTFYQKDRVEWRAWNTITDAR